MSVKFLGAVRDGMKYYNATEILNQGLEQEKGFIYGLIYPMGHSLLFLKVAN